MMQELVFLLEEASAKAMLQGVLGRILPPGLEVQYRVFEGKSDLEKRLVPQIRGYKKPGAYFVVLRDKDSALCLNVKQELVRKCQEAGRPETLVRIACHEIESWYLADLKSVEKGLGISDLSGQQVKEKFRNPDNLANPKQELEKLTDCRYQKIAGSRAIGPYLDIENTRSKSFSVFISGIKRFVERHHHSFSE